MHSDNIFGRYHLLTRVLAIPFFAALALALLTPSALAHKVNVFAWVEGDTVHVEGYFAGKRKAQNSLVEVYDSSGAKFLEGKTNQQGEFSFKIPKKTDLKIVLTASMGHKNDFVILASDLGDVSPHRSVEADAGSQLYEKKMVSAPTTSQVDLSQVESLLDKTLDRKLSPLIRIIRESQQKGPTVSEVIGGIGYIFGLMGVALYFMSRKRG